MEKVRRTVEQVTGFPEILGGRVKTLHPKIQGGILARRDKAQMNELKKLGIQPIDMVVVNLYPFERTVAPRGALLSVALQQIDIGCVTLIRQVLRILGTCVWLQTQKDIQKYLPSYGNTKS